MNKRLPEGEKGMAKRYGRNSGAEIPEETEKSDGALPESTMKTGLKSTAEPVKQDASDYLGSDTGKVTASDLAGMNAQKLTYARHRKVFRHNELNRYFQTKSWYHADTMTSSLEQNNASFILQYQKDNGSEYTQGN